MEEVDYKYDVWGNLVETDSYPTGSGSPVVTRYAVDGWNPALAGATGNANFNVWADLDGSNNLLTRYFHGDQVDQLFARQDVGVQYWYLTDYQGSVRDVLDNSGNVKDAIVYDGFGNIISETNSAYRGNYGWTGRMFDVETDLQYNRARWYDPTTGRWQSQDPLGFDAGDSNLYRYAFNGPTVLSDPSGAEVPPLEAAQAGIKITDELVETLSGVGTGLQNKTMELDPDFLLRSNKLAGKTSQNEGFAFTVGGAYKGSYLKNIPNPKNPDTIIGAYVNLKFQVDSKRFQKIKFIQLVREVRKTQEGALLPIDPLDPNRRALADWGNATCYPGWRVDFIPGNKGPWTQGYVNEGKAGVEFWDAPGFYKPGQNPKNSLPASDVGREFITIAVGWNDGQAPEYLGSVRWGYYVDEKQKVTLVGPTLDSQPPMELGFALQRFNESTYNGLIALPGKPQGIQKFNQGIAGGWLVPYVKGVDMLPYYPGNGYPGANP